jgi:flagellar motor switch protein FliG
MFKGGKEEAIAMLNLLSSTEAENLIEKIRLKDPHLASELEDNLIKMEDLVHLTQMMKVTLLKDVSLEKFGLALRTLDSSVTEKILEDLPSGIILDIEDGLKGKPRPLSEAQKAQEEILAVVREKVSSGQIILRDDETYV